MNKKSIFQNSIFKKKKYWTDENQTCYNVIEDDQSTWNMSIEGIQYLEIVIFTHGHI